MKKALIKTLLGDITAVSSNKGLHHLEFQDMENLRKFEEIPFGRTEWIDQIEWEISEYFAHKRRHFKTPYIYSATPFQEAVWHQLVGIPFGETVSYKDVAEGVKRSLAVRAVGTAVGANPLAIIIPCHRVIQSSGALGGYRGGLDRKKWLLEHESKNLLCDEEILIRCDHVNVKT